MSECFHKCTLDPSVFMSERRIVIHESSCEREINVNEGIHARLINSVSSAQRGTNKLPGFETKLINTSGRGENI